MSKLSWSSRVYESGVDRGVLYLDDGSGVAWSGLIGVTETNSSFTSTASYIDGYKYALRQVPGGFSASLEAFTYPDEFEEYDGLTGDIYTNQKRKSFNFSYRTMVNEKDYKIHLVYGAVTKPSDRDNQSIGSEVSPATFSWDLIADAHYVIDSTETNSDALASLESALYGSETAISSFPVIEDVIELFESHASLRITDNGDGTWTAEGDGVTMVDATTFKIDSPSVIFLTADTFRVTSY